VQDEPPSWPSDSDDNMGLESMSDPDMDLDMPEDDGDGDGDGDDPQQQQQSPENGQGRGIDEDDDSEDDEAEDAEYYDAREGIGKSPLPSPMKSAASEEDTEEDVMGPITPGPTRSTFGNAQSKTRDSTLEGLDDDDDWVDPAAPSPKSKRGKKARNSPSTPTAASSVPVVKTPVRPTQQHFPFPSSSHADDEGRRVPQMSTARGRDGGRTQSGGVKGILTEDGDDF
jgi:cysteine protease ATG4